MTSYTHGKADALMNDMDYDEAVTDFKAALEGVHGEQANEIQMKLREANQKRNEWNGGEKNHRYNEHTGHPDGQLQKKKKDKQKNGTPSIYLARALMGCAQLVLHHFPLESITSCSLHLC